MVWRPSELRSAGNSLWEDGAPSSRVGQKSRVHANGQDSTEFLHGFLLLQLTDAYLVAGAGI